MVTLDKRQIKEIAEQLDCGFRAFYQKTTGELVFFPDTLKSPTADVDAFVEEQEELNANGDDYVEVEAMRSTDSYRVMVDFTEQLTNTLLQEKLFRALNKRGPFREFKFVIDDSGDFREQWFAFKNQRYVDWVSQQVQANQ